MATSFWILHEYCLSWHSDLYVLPSLPHTGCNEKK